MQYIRDEESILSAAEFFRGISVTGEPDGIFSTEGGQGLSLQDEEGHTIISIFIQAGMIDSADGRREAHGLSGIRNIPGLMTPADWEEYYAKQQEAEETYRKTHQLNYPCTLFEAEGKEAFDFYEACTAEEIDSIYFFHNGKNEYVTDRDAIQKIYDGLCKVQVTGPGEASRSRNYGTRIYRYTGVATTDPGKTPLTRIWGCRPITSAPGGCSPAL